MYIKRACNSSALYQRRFEVAPPFSRWPLVFASSWCSFSTPSFPRRKHGVAPAILPWCGGWLALTRSCQGWVPLLLPPAGLLLPALTCSLQPGEQGTRKCACAGGSASCSCPARMWEINRVGFPQLPRPTKPGGHHSASGRPQVEARACQGRKAPGHRGQRLRGAAEKRVQLCGALRRAGPGGVFIVWLIWVQPAKFGRLPEVATWKTSVVINFSCHACFEIFLILW